MRREQRERSTEYWREVISEHSLEAGCKREFFKRHGISARQFYYWRSRLKEGGKPIGSEPKFSEYQLSLPISVPEYELKLKSGRALIIRGSFEEHSLKGLVSILESLSC